MHRYHIRHGDTSPSNLVVPNSLIDPHSVPPNPKPKPEGPVWIDFAPIPRAADDKNDDGTDAAWEDLNANDASLLWMTTRNFFEECRCRHKAYQLLPSGPSSPPAGPRPDVELSEPCRTKSIWVAEAERTSTKLPPYIVEIFNPPQLM